MSIPFDKTFLLVPSSRSSVKVKVRYQGHNFQKMAVAGAFVFHEHILLFFYFLGQERFTSMTRVYYKDAHACIVMFDLTQRLTFQNAVRWKKDLDAKCTLQDGTPVPCLLLANKVTKVLWLFYLQWVYVSSCHIWVDI